MIFVIESLGEIKKKEYVLVSLVREEENRHKVNGNITLWRFFVCERDFGLRVLCQ